MINVMRKSDDKFSIIVNDVETESLTVDELFKVMRSLEVEFEEIELGVVELVRNEHRYANYGINRRFIFTK